MVKSLELKINIPPWMGVIIVILLVIIVAILLLYFNEKGFSILHSDQNKSWHNVAEFIGASKGGNYPFEIQGDKFRITYTVSQNEKYLDLLTIFVVPSYILEQKGGSGASSVVFNPNKSVTVTFPIMGEMGAEPITLTSEEYGVYQGGSGSVTDKVRELTAWEDEQRYENTGEISGTYIYEDYVKSLGERKKERNNFAEFFYSYNSPSQTSISNAGAGEYYVVVKSYNLESWKIVIEDYY